MTRRIKLTPALSRVVDATTDAFRLTIVASDAEDMPTKIFRYLQRPSAPGSSERTGFFDGVCSPVDLEEMPEDDPRPNEEPAWYRLETLDLLFRSQHDRDEAKTDIYGAVIALLNTLDLVDALEVQPPIWFGVPPESSSSSSSSSSSAESSSA